MYSVYVHACSTVLAGEAGHALVGDVHHCHPSMHDVPH